MADQDQISDQGIYAVVDKVIKDLLPFDSDNRLRVYRTVGTFFGFDEVYSKVAGKGDGRAPANISREPRFSNSEVPTPKEFLLSKRPNTNIERVACLAYYLAHYKDVHQFKPIDINKLNTEAAQTKLSDASQAIRHAVRAGYLAAATKDTKQLSAEGEQYVEALPDRNAAKEVKPRSSRRSRKKTSTNRTEGDRGESESK